MTNKKHTIHTNVTRISDFHRKQLAHKPKATRCFIYSAFVVQKLTIRKMTTVRCFLLIAFVFYICSQSANAQYLLQEVLPIGVHDKNVKRLSQAVYLFSTDLYLKIIESNREENVFFSPASLYVALAMLYAGSGGETKTQLASALHLHFFESDEEGFYKSIKLLHERLSITKKNYTLKMANRLFGRKGLPIKDEYLRRTEENFGAKLEALDFAKDPSGSRSKINNWVSEMTSKKIKELFPDGSITSGTVLAIANAVYFNGSWMYRFNKQMTKPHTFYESINRTIQVPMMHLLQSKGLRYSSSKYGFKLLELPYSDEDVSTIIAMDERKEGKPNFNMLLTASVAANSWKQLSNVRTNIAVQVSLPKFSLQKTLDLKNSLSALGIKNLFGSANLSGISDSRPLELSKAIHKAYITVDEEGTKATAATGLNIKTKSLPSSKTEIIDFVVDRPFLMIVIDKRTECFLFFGHIQNPLKAN